jgi:hypothetical protein
MLGLPMPGLQTGFTDSYGRFSRPLTVFNSPGKNIFARPDLVSGMPLV